MVSAGDDKQKINSEAKMPREEEYICEICMARLDNIDHLHKHRSLNIMPPLAYDYPIVASCRAMGCLDNILKSDMRLEHMTMWRNQSYAKVKNR